MAKYKLQEMSDVHHDGKRKVYPKMVANRTLSRKEFIDKMQGYHRGISPSTTEAVLMDVEDMLVRMLSMGYNVNLEGLGTFSLSLGSRMTSLPRCRVMMIRWPIVRWA